MILMRMRDDDAGEVLALFLSKSDVGQHEVDTRVSGPPKLTPTSTISHSLPLPLPRP